MGSHCWSRWVWRPTVGPGPASVSAAGKVLEGMIDRHDLFIIKMRVIEVVVVLKLIPLLFICL